MKLGGSGVRRIVAPFPQEADDLGRKVLVGQKPIGHGFPVPVGGRM